MAHKKAGGSTKNGRDSKPKYLGVKRQDGQLVLAGEIIVRQRGYTYHAGQYAGVGRDYTVYALKAGVVRYKRQGKKQVIIMIDPIKDQEAA
jgi:large subunit ribosomal protein L27|tara:strand:+ start:184 stop:456 length:273 start_codon:yes stop_codon:yes gene_type:complete